ncbi:hypothetical protein [Actinacidiphila oryziradicis]|uniref:Sortase n=1 Tax=Actinacidiphila oryziradicis TaxID=2571141 RepID=A0A4V5MZ19_9ACTN|nr:hypothetical protein [Actinacidiphila oryziradicis]TKA06339.1 hypothetical protein FCI23_32355 [Actinacidiphila oryziradicis]
MRELIRRPAQTCAVLAALIVLCGCGAARIATEGRSGETPIATGVIIPDGTTGPSNTPAEAPAAPGTAILLQNRSVSYTPAVASHPSAYRQLDPIHPTLTVARGTVLELRLSATWFTPPTSSDPQVLRPTQARWKSTTANARFLAASQGQSILTAQALPCPKAPVACPSSYRLIVVVTPGG